MIGIEETTGLQRVDGTPVPDAALDSTSTNSVQNKVVTENINQINSDLTDLDSRFKQEEYVSETADGVKTYGQLLTVLLTKVDHSKVSFNTKIKFGNNVANVSYFDGTTIRFGTVNSTWFYLLTLSSTAPQYVYFNATTMARTDATTAVVPSDTTFEVHY